MSKTRFVLLVLSLSLLAGSDSQWILEQSTLSYQVSHPLHQLDGASHAARGKGTCHLGQCDFLIAVPVKSFDSGDSNRDLHMLQVTRGGQFPMVTVRTRLPEQTSAAASIHADLDLEFAGQTVHYIKMFPFSSRGKETRLRPPELFPRS
jgi:hypothetical protein